MLLNRQINKKLPRIAFLLALTLVRVLFCGTASYAQDVKIKLIADQFGYLPDHPLRLGVYFVIEKDWHIYWKNPGDSGTAPKIVWDLPPGMAAGEIQWPTPKRLPIGPLVNYGFENDLLLISELTGEPARSSLTIRAKIDWLVCKEDCYPGSGTAALELPVIAKEPTSEVPAAALFKTFRGLQPSKSGLPVEIVQFERSVELNIHSTFPFDEDISVYFFPDKGGLIEHAADQAVSVSDSLISLQLKRPLNPLPHENFSGVVVFDRPWNKEVSSRAFSFSLPLNSKSVNVPLGAEEGIVLQILFAFIGGFLLNIMPCVFPVLSLKVLHFLELSGEERRAIKTHGILFSAGVVTSFLALASLILLLKSFGTELGWGFQLQSPNFVAGMCFFLLAIALNLSGVFEVGASLQRAAGHVLPARGYLGSFLDGVLAVVLASPCSAPFMGAAIAYALTASSLTVVIIFLALAAGMAAPFLLLSFSPALIGFLPRPGAWMENFRKICAFPMLATIAWLVWVYGKLAGDDAVLLLLLALTGVALALFFYGTFAQSASKRSTRIIRTAIAALIGLVAIISVLNPAPVTRYDSQEGPWIPYTQSKFEEIVATGRPIFIDFTAAWCITCQVNKKLVLNSAPVMEAFNRKGVTLMRADWTAQNEEITKALLGYGYRSVPVYVLHLPGGKTPKIFPSILTHSMIVESLSDLVYSESK